MRQARSEWSAKSAEIACLENILYVINAATSKRTRGGKPVGQAPIKTLLAAYLYMAQHPITLGYSSQSITRFFNYQTRRSKGHFYDGDTPFGATTTTQA